MKIFVSWSGEQSHKIAKLLRSWMPNVLQEAEVFVSSQDIEKGEFWASILKTELAQDSLGIVVVTADNYSSPWVLFEAGALFKSLNSRVIPLLCGVDMTTLSTSPLRLLQAAKSATRDEMWAIIQAVANQAERKLGEERVKSAFEKWWPEFEQGYAPIASNAAPADVDGEKPDKVLEALNSLLADTQSIKRMLRRDKDHRTIESIFISSLAKNSMGPLATAGSLSLAEQSGDQSIQGLMDLALKPIVGGSSDGEE